MIYGNKFLPKNIVENSMFAVESVVCEEYFNRIDLLESCTDESSRPILEAQVQVLYEISFKDIIEKIKEIWEKFKAWVRDLWNKIFDKEKYQKEREEKAHKAAEKFVNSIFEETDKKAYEKTAILRNIYFPFWSEDEESAGENRIFRMAKYPGDLESLVKRYIDHINKDCNTAEVMIGPTYKFDGKDEAIKSLEEYITSIKRHISDIDKYKIFFKPIIELEGSQFIGILNNYRLDVEDDSKENLLKVDKIFVNTIYAGFEDDRRYIQTIKKDLDERIKNMDKKIYTDITHDINIINAEIMRRQADNDELKKESDKNRYRIDRNNRNIAENKEAIEKLQNDARAIRACITAFQSETNCIADLEVHITKSIDRAISEHEKLVKNLREKYHTDTDGSDTSKEV